MIVFSKISVLDEKDAERKEARKKTKRNSKAHSHNYFFGARNFVFVLQEQSQEQVKTLKQPKKFDPSAPQTPKNGI